jgi:endonuclease YncB( thermonuclease family)
LSADPFRLIGVGGGPVLIDQILGYLMDFLRWAIVALLSTFAAESYAPWTGTVVEIVRPDEIKVADGDKRVETVRLYGLDSPLEPQPFARQARAYVSDRVFGKLVKVQPLPGRISGPWYNPGIHRYDRYHRIVALVSIDGESLNKELLKKGIARWYRPYVPFERGFKYLEDEAGQAHEGMWAYPNPIPPWEFQVTAVHAAHQLQAPVRTEGSTGAPASPGQPVEKAGATGGQATSQPDKETSVVRNSGFTEAVPREDGQKTCADDYEPKLKHAYRKIAGAAAADLYVCRQIAGDWQSRQMLVKAYEHSAEPESDREQMLKEVSDPCPLYTATYNNVKKLWEVGAQLRMLRSEPTGDPERYNEKVEDLSYEYRNAVTEVTRQFKW